VLLHVDVSVQKNRVRLRGSETVSHQPHNIRTQTRRTSRRPRCGAALPPGAVVYMDIALERSALLDA